MRDWLAALIAWLTGPEEPEEDLAKYTAEYVNDPRRREEIHLAALQNEEELDNYLRSI